MLLFDGGYEKAIKRAVREAEVIDVAVAFWGSGGETIFQRWSGRRLRIICNLAQGGTNPKAIRALLELPNVEVLQQDDLHAKLILTDKSLIVGSANVSSNGLGLEGAEQAAWRELGMLSESSSERSTAKRWFAIQWAAARTIKELDLKKAEAAWKARRKMRPKMAFDTKTGLLEQPENLWEDRAVHFAVYREGLSDAAELELAHEQTCFPHAELDLYEGWEEEELPTESNAVIIPVYWGTKGKVEVHPAQQPVPGLNRKVETADGLQRLDFTRCIEDESTLDFLFDSKERKRLVAPVSAWLKASIDLTDGGVCRPVQDFLLWLKVNGEKPTA